MALTDASLRCDECDRQYEPESDAGSYSAVKLGREARRRDPSWKNTANGFFCPRCIAKADRGTLVVEPAMLGC